MRNATILSIVVLIFTFSYEKAYATATVGLIHEGVVYMGSDSAGTAGSSIRLRADEKVFIVDDKFIIGFAGSFRMGQLLRYECKYPNQKRGQSVSQFMVTTFIDSIRKCFKDGGFAAIRDKQERGGFFLVGYKGHLFNIQGDYQVAEGLDPYDAIGSGSDLALGSLFSTPELDPNERITRALSAAEKFDAKVRKPFIILSLPLNAE